MAVTRINNNQITDSSAGNIYVGINAGTKLQDYSITAGKIANSLTYGSDLTITGNLTVNGQTTTIDTVSTVIEDPLIVLASNQTGAPAVDIGFIGERGDQNNIAFVWDESADEFVTAFTTDLVTNTTITISSYANFHTNDANIGGNITINGTTSLVGNISSALNVTGNITGGNLLTPGVVTATGNVTGGNINTGGQVVATGNVTGTGIVMSGNITGGNILSGGQVIVTGNINGGNVNAVNDLTAEHLYTTGNAYIGGNLIVSGNLSYININDLRVEDPIIILGTGPNGAPLTSNDNLDRGVYMEYYVGAQGNAFMGWQNSTGNLIAASNVTFASNDVVSVNTYGTFQAGNLYIQSALSTGNITGTGVVMSGNITGGNLLTGAQVVAAGNITGANINTGGQVVATGNVTSGNLILTSGFIDSTGSRITINGSDADVDFAVDGDTQANIFYVDAGTGTASFGNSTQTTNAIVAFNATNSILMPVGNTTQRPGTGVVGMLRFNTIGDALEVYDSTGWTEVGTPVFTVIADQQFNGDGSTVAYTLGSSQTTASCIVSINGVVQIPTIAYSVSGTTLTFTEAPEPGDIIDVRQLTTTTTVTSISNTGGNAVVQPNPLTANVDVTGNLVVSGSVSASSFIGLDATKIANGTSEMAVIASGGNIRANIGGTTVQTISTGLVAITGDLSVSGNATLSGNILGDRVVNGTTSFEIQTPSGNANITVGATSNVAVFTTTGLAVAGTVSVSGTGNVTGANIVATVDVFTPEIVKTGSNAVGNIGQSDNYFNRVFAQATSALYADLAEKYVADADYAPGTVIVFGGDKEVTVSSTDADRAVAGVVSTNPSYIMNSGLEAEYVATVALTGRVPCRVTGSVRKGDLMVSAGYGVARAEADPKVGTVIGKALENHEGNEGVIEVVVGRF
jgi:trimeric autotransporter adhesin